MNVPYQLHGSEYEDFELFVDEGMAFDEHREQEDLERQERLEEMFSNMLNQISER